MSYIPYTTASPNSVDKIFALVDCNSFYASCEKLFRPDLRHRPVIVLSNNDGCVVARSKEAKEIGIPIATPFFKIKPLIKRHRVSFFPQTTLYMPILVGELCPSLLKWLPTSRSTLLMRPF